MNVADSKIVKNEQNVIIEYENLDYYDDYDLYTALTETEESELSDDDIIEYISSEYSDYEIYMEITKN